MFLKLLNYSWNSRIVRRRLPIIVLVAVCAAATLLAMDRVRAVTRTDQAIAKYHVTGRGVTVVILDRGIDWTNDDFRNPDGSTRIKWLLDMSGQNWCSSTNPVPVEYSGAQINAALRSGPAIAERDAIGHGTLTAGAAAGNGRAYANGSFRGIAPDADLVIVKMTSDGAPAHDGYAAEAPFVACIDRALDWVDAKIATLGQPAVGIINSGTQWGPVDGTSAVSRKLDTVFGLDRPGRVYVAPAGDEGNMPTHAAGSYSTSAPGVVHFKKSRPDSAYAQVWYSGSAPAQIQLGFADGYKTTIAPGGATDTNGVTAYQYLPGNAPYPWTSNGPDRAVWIHIVGHAGDGTLTVTPATSSGGRFDFYSDYQASNIQVLDGLAMGSLTDYSSTKSAVVVGAYVLRDSYVAEDGATRTTASEGSAGQLWLHSSTGPTRDGRPYGIDVVAPGHNEFSSVGKGAYWATKRGVMRLDGGGHYMWFGATSGAGPIVVGTVALMLQLNPKLTAADVKRLLRESANADGFTGPLPNPSWGFGKLDVLNALDRVAAMGTKTKMAAGDSRPN